MNHPDSPFIKRPTETLRYNRIATVKKNNNYSTSSISSTTAQQQQQQQQQPIGLVGKSISSIGVKNKLDDESGKRIAEFVYQTKGGSIIDSSREKRMNESSQKISESGHSNTFYIPNNTKSRKDEIFGPIIDTISDVLKIPTSRNIDGITKEFLMSNNVTIDNLINDCEVSIIELKVAGILNSFQDLKDLKFTPYDLVSNRKLFNCGVIGNVFNVKYSTILEYRIEFDIRHILEGKFYPSELMSLKYDIGKAIDDQGIISAQLKKMNYSLEDLRTLGFKLSHVKRLGITPQLACTRQPEGFGWPKDYLELLQ